MDLPDDSNTLPHDNQAYVLISVVIPVVSIATLSVALRIYTRTCLLKQVGADDYLALLSLLLAIATGISECINTTHGLGKHSWDLQTPGEVVAYFKNFYVNITLYNVGLLVVKLTFLTQYYRVLVLKRFQTVCIVAMITVGAWGLSQIFVGLLICTPVAGFWDTTVDAKCVPVPLQWYINAGGNIVTDIIVFVLPLPVLVHLKLPRVQRLSLVGIFSFGFFTCAISVIRIKFLGQGGDFSYENVEASIWSITELCSGITCVCLPTLRPFVSQFIPKLAGTLHRSSIGYLRHSPSPGADVGEGRKHTRQGSKESNAGAIGNEDRLRRPDAPFDADVRTSGDTSDGITGLHSARGSPSGGYYAPLASPDPTYTPARVRSGPSMHISWMRPGVTTTISTGTKEAGRSHEDPSIIHITHDITMQEIPPSKL
ncbi:hypothetical protein O1611_g6256 [Lasiodiplodia mahajangana]|uniref:Uncharacterized protein n=1 Tax=Lasiodiplodia mahajangana TaxID=1108764 RepID=A0ACC2JIY0_9PEZI|nr:hypothetical protein O1611_g6256 [Lasiodiplodia mahajangana]